MENDDGTTNPPFSRKKNNPPLHLREWTEAEYAQYLRLRTMQEWGVRETVENKETKKSE